MRSRIYAVDVVNSSDAAHFIVWKRDGLLAPYVPEDVAQALSGRAQGRRWLVRELPRRAERHRLQHRPGEAGGRAEELRRSARSEMEGQDRQGASELQRHHHDRDLPVGARPRLAVSSRSSRSRRSCRCSRRPTRRRSSRSASAPCRPTATSTTCSSSRKPASRSSRSTPAEGTPLVVGPNGMFKNAPNPNAARLFQSYCFSAGVPAARLDVGGLRSVHPQTKEKAGPQAVQGDQDDERRRRRRRKDGRRDQDALQQALQGVRTAHAQTDILPTRHPQGLDGARRRHGVRRAGAGGGAAGRGDHAGADRGGEEGGQVRLLHRHGPAIRREARQGLRGEVPRHQCAGRAFRRRARVHAHRPGIFEQRARGRRGQHRRPVALHRLEAQRLACALYPGRGRQALRQGLLRPRRLRGGHPRVWCRRSASTPIW